MHFHGHEYLRVTHFEAKPVALIMSRFKEVLFLDADNYATRDPTYLFEDEMYRKTGAVFWPDYGEFTDPGNPIWLIIDQKPFIVNRSQESGQILINKEVSWQALMATFFMNMNSRYYYLLMYGDKDTFQFGCLTVGKEFHMVKYLPGVAGFVRDQCEVAELRDPDCKGYHGHTMVQHDLEGRPLFLHRTLSKHQFNLTVIPNDLNLYKRTWESIQRWESDQNKHHFLISTDLFGIRLLGSITNPNFQTDIGYDLETICLKLLLEMKQTGLFKQSTKH